jgi:hypothetical protein
MKPDAMVVLDGPRTVTLSAQTLANILDAIAEMPFKKAKPMFDELISQLQTETKSDTSQPE